MYTRSNIICCH